MPDVRLIDANALIKHFAALQNLVGEYCECFKNASGELSAEWNCIESIVENAPTIDAVEVVHGQWKRCFEDWRHQLEGDECSACGFQHYGMAIDHYLYCPNCGARMDAKEAEHGQES